MRGMWIVVSGNGILDRLLNDHTGRVRGCLSGTALWCIERDCGPACDGRGWDRGFRNRTPWLSPTLSLQSLAYVAAGALGLAMPGRKAIDRITVEQLSADSA